MTRPQIKSNDVESPSIIERDLSSDLDYEGIQAAPIQDEASLKRLDDDRRLRAFMEEPVTFQIAEVDDPNAPDPVPCGVNGVHKHFRRGETYTVPRKFIESVLKISWKVKTIMFKDKDGVDQTRVEQTPSMVYPISILHDPSGMGPNDNGRRWFLHQQRNG